jgi:CheY-like chemotaxis protein
MTFEPQPETAAPPTLTVLSAHDLAATPAGEPGAAPPGREREFPPGPPVLRLVELSLNDVEPLAEPAPAPRALIAEDSMVAAIFLTRLLEQVGFVVVPVGTADELHRMSATTHWSLVFADVELPDAIAGHGLSGLEPKDADGRAAPVIALVRDADDIAHARAFGVQRVLTKPFEAERVQSLLGELGFGR